MNLRFASKTTSLQFVKNLIEQRLPVAVELEFRFCEDRLWRFDLAIPARKIALEVEGGLFTQGAHVRGARITKTHERDNFATIRGWRILRCTPKEVQNGKAFTLLHDCLTFSS